MTTYQERHDTQYEPRTWSSSLDCNMNAAADGARFFSLGLKDHRHDYYRGLCRNADGTPDRTGGTNIDQAHDVLDRVGVPSTIYDSADGKGWSFVETQLNAGNQVIAHGDYGSTPRYERGEIAPDFTGFHSVIFTRIATVAGERQVRVGDGLSAAYEWWPVSVAKKYMADFPGGGFTFIVIKPRKLCARVAKAYVRDDPNRNKAPLGSISPRSRIHVGGTVRGESIGGNATWYRVWYKGKIGYVHSSVGKIV